MRAWTHQALTELSRPRPWPRIEYGCDRSQLLPELQSRFVQLSQDDAAKAFLEQCRPSSIFAIAAFNILHRFWSITDTNAWLGGGQMHVLSQAHAEQLLDMRPPEGPAWTPGTTAASSTDRRPRRLLDVGAGDGNVTSHLAPLFDQVVATDVSPGMVKHLQSRGYRGVVSAEVTEEAVGSEPFDVVSLLNVLDRCDRPKSLLRDIRSRLRPEDGKLLLAVVLPFKPFVEDGSRQKPPTERLAVTSRRWEAAVNELVQRVFRPCGFETVKVARVPYYSQVYSAVDDPAFVTLDDALFVLQPAEEIPSVSQKLTTSPHSAPPQPGQEHDAS